MFGLRPDSNAADKKSERGGFGEGCRSTGEWERAHSCDYAYVMGDGGGGGRVGMRVDFGSGEELSGEREGDA